MRTIPLRRLLIALPAALAVGSLAAPASALPLSHPAGTVGSPVTLLTGATYTDYDVAARPDGTAYIGWISTTGTSTDRTVHLCTLPPAATACTGGVQSVAALDPASTSGLHVVVTAGDVVHLLWLHDTDNSINGPHGAAIAEATAVHGLNLGAPQDVVTDAPSFGQLLDAEPGPGGTIWTVSYPGVPSRQLQVRAGISAPYVAVTAPYAVSFGQLAFSAGKPVVSAEKYGSVSTAAHYATGSSDGATWSAFHAVPHTWTGGGAVLKSTSHGLRLVTNVNNASYRPVISKWTGSAFSTPQLTPDHNSCGPISFDGRSDASGRLVTVSWECNRVTIANFPDAAHAAVVRFTVNSTPSGEPQIASGTRGIATVVYTVTGSNGDSMRAVHVRLPDATHSASTSRAGGRVTVTGPRSCLPPVNVHVGWTHHAASGWKFTSGTLRLNGKIFTGTTLDGARLAAGTKNTLTGTAVFGRPGHTSKATASLVFTSCPTS